MPLSMSYPQGDNISYSPKEEFDWEGLARLAQMARQARQIRDDRATLRGMLGDKANAMLGQAQPEPTTLGGRVMRGLGDMFGVNREAQPLSDIQRAVINEQIKQSYPEEWKPTTMAQALQFEQAKAGMKRGSIADPAGLTADQQLQARALSRKLYGVRGAEYGLPAVFEEMRKGKSIDEIEDSLRYAGQSKEFAGPVRNAVQTIMINADSNKAQNAMDYIDDQLSKGNTDSVKQQVKRLARAQTGVEEMRSINGMERTVKLLDDIQNDLNTFEANGGNTNIFTGTAEQVAGKLGTVRNPEMRKLATKIMAAIQNYRRSMSGVAFSVPESKEYTNLFPSISKTANFNSANIQGLKEVMQGNLENFYALSMGEDNYKQLFGGNNASQSQTPGQSKAQGQGGTKPITANIAKEFLQRAGGNKAKARELASQAGYSF